MTNPFIDTARNRGRRAFLGSISAACTGLLAGCGGAENEGQEGGTPSAGSNDTNDERDGQVLQEEIEILESVFRSLSELPVTEDGAFVFDVNYFEEEFDHERLLERIDTVENGIQSANGSEMTSSKVDNLSSIAETARLLVQQRVLVHQVIAAGLVCERRLGESEFDQATEAITHARQYVVNLDDFGERIEQTVPADRNQHPDIDGYEPLSIRRTQKNLADIALWTDAAYEGVYHATKGLHLFVEGNSALERERYEVASEEYAKSNDHFEQAGHAFETAHGRGTKLPYLVPLVEDLRCILPAYLSSTERFDESMRYLNAGEETRGKEIAREGIESADRIASRCIGGRR